MFFIISFYLMDKHLAYRMIFFALVGVFAFVLDVVQNWVAVKEEAR